MAVHGSIVMLMALLASLVASPAGGSFPAGTSCSARKQGMKPRWQ